MSKPKLDMLERSLFVRLTFAFVTCTIVGTLTHEFGHFFTAEYMGYEAHISYMSTWLTQTRSTVRMSDLQCFCFDCGGPIQTMITGTIGMILLKSRRAAIVERHSLLLTDWLVVFISMFWLRQSANFVIWVGGYLFLGTFSLQSDESHIARHLNLPDWSLVGSTALVGALILLYVILRIIPRSQRVTFMASGLVGGISGYLLWMHLLGPIILP